jgi:hypothetical protein
MMMCFPFVEGLARVERDGKDGFVDTTGEEIIPPLYRTAEFFGNHSFSEGLAAVTDANATNWW